MKVICIDDKNRPDGVPVSKWIKEGEQYTVIRAVKCNAQGGLLGFELAEISLVGYEPYLYYSAHRFIPVDLPVELNDKVESEIEQTELV